jgi:membrane-associated phospholipid phosphatase
VVKKTTYLLLIFFLFNFHLSSVYAQDSLHLLNNNARQSHYLKPTALIVPGTFLIYSGLKPFIDAIPKLDNKIMSSVRENYPDFHTNAADYLMWMPTASLYAMDALKVKTKHNFKEHLILDAGSILITGGLGYGMRIISKKMKVYNAEDTKFPSGHAANAFRGAEILHQELKEQHPILSYSGYVVATGVGILRIYNKNHLFTEVLAGAGLGIISTKLTYWVFDKVNFAKREKPNNLF